MPDVPLLLTKLLVPPVRSSLERPRLLDMLTLGLDTALTVVVGGAGYGKTTVLAQWAREQEAPFWYRVDAADSDLAAFVRHLHHGLRERWGLAAGHLGALLGGADHRLPAPERLAAAVLADILAGGAGSRILILDDYHEVGPGAPTHLLVERLVAAAPPNLHLFIAGRAAPPLPLDRLRARGHLTEIGQADLEFSPEEAAALFRDVYRARLAPAEADRLHRLTGGWVTGLYLAHYARQQGDRDWLERGADLAYRFFLEEVLEQASPAEGRLLLFASLVPELDAAAAVALTGDPGAGATLGVLAAQHRFLLPLGRGSFQLHPLFREHLRRELAARHGPEAIAAAQARLADLYLAAGQPDRAVAHLLAARRWPEVARYLEAHLPRLGYQAQWALLGEIVAQAPPAEHPAYAWWIMARGRLAEGRGDQEGAIGAYRAAAARLAADGNRQGFTLARRTLVLALMGGGRSTEALALLRELEQDTDPDALAWRPTLLNHLAQVLFRTGQPAAAEAALEAALQEARRAGDRLLEARARNSQAIYVHVGRHRLARARRALTEALALVEPFPVPTVQAILRANLGVTLAGLGEYDAALATLRDAADRAGALQDGVGLARALEGVGLVHSLRGDFAPAEECLQRAWAVGEGIALRALCVATQLCNLYRRWGRPELAVTWGARAADLGPPVGMPHLTVEALAEYALALLAAGRPEAARAPLAQAEALAGAPSYRGDRVVLDLAWFRLLAGQDTPEAAAARRRWQAVQATPEFAPWLASEAVAARPPAERPYSLTLLGAFRLERGGTALSLRPMVQKLLATLALRGGRPMARDELAGLLWPGAAPEAGLNSLRVALHQLRRVASDLLAVTGGSVGVRPGALRVDATEFQERLDSADRLWAGDDLEGAVQAYQAAVALYRGDLVAPDAADGWAEHLRQRYVAALLRLARHALATGAPARAGDLCEQALASDPYREDAYRLLMRVAARSGGARAVQATYRRLQGALAELRLAPTAGTRRLLQQLLTGA